MSNFLRSEFKSNLIKFVSQTPALYDKDNPYVGDKNYREAVWIEITKKLGLEGTGEQAITLNNYLGKFEIFRIILGLLQDEQVAVVKKHWRNLRQDYRRKQNELQLKKSKFNQKHLISSWPHFQEMSFLDNFPSIYGKRDRTNIRSETSNKTRIQPRRRATIYQDRSPLIDHDIDSSLSSYLLNNQASFIEEEMQEVPDVVQTQL